MIGWSRRSTESNERRRKYREWYENATEEEREEDFWRNDAEIRRDVIIYVVIGGVLLGLFIVLLLEFFK